MRTPTTISEFDEQAPKDQRRFEYIQITIVSNQMCEYHVWRTTVDPETNEFLHVKLYSTRTTALTELFLSELREKHDTGDVVFLVDPAPSIKAALDHLGFGFRDKKHGNRNAVERSFKEIEHLSSQFRYVSERRSGNR